MCRVGFMQAADVSVTRLDDRAKLVSSPTNEWFGCSNVLFGCRRRRHVHAQRLSH